MNEELRPRQQIGAKELTRLEKAEKYSRLIVAGLLMGYGSVNAIEQEPDRGREKPATEFTIPSTEGWQRLSGEYEEFNIWVSDEADAFIQQNPIRFFSDATAETGKGYLRNFREVKIYVSPFNKSMLVIDYFRKDGKGSKRVELIPKADGKFERYEYNF